MSEKEINEQEREIEIELEKSNESAPYSTPGPSAYGTIELTPLPMAGISHTSILENFHKYCQTAQIRAYTRRLTFHSGAIGLPDLFEWVRGGHQPIAACAELLKQLHRASTLLLYPLASESNDGEIDLKLKILCQLGNNDVSLQHQLDDLRRYNESTLINYFTNLGIDPRALVRLCERIAKLEQPTLKHIEQLSAEYILIRQIERQLRDVGLPTQPLSLFRRDTIAATMRNLRPPLRAITSGLYLPVVEDESGARPLPDSLYRALCAMCDEILDSGKANGSEKLLEAVGELREALRSEGEQLAAIAAEQLFKAKLAELRQTIVSGSRALQPTLLERDQLLPPSLQLEIEEREKLWQRLCEAISADPEIIVICHGGNQLTGALLSHLYALEARALYDEDNERIATLRALIQELPRLRPHAINYIALLETADPDLYHQAIGWSATEKMRRKSGPKRRGSNRRLVEELLVMAIVFAFLLSTNAFFFQFNELVFNIATLMGPVIALVVLRMFASLIELNQLRKPISDDGPQVPTAATLSNAAKDIEEEGQNRESEAENASRRLAGSVLDIIFPAKFEHYRERMRTATEIEKICMANLRTITGAFPQYKKKAPEQVVSAVLSALRSHPSVVPIQMPNEIVPEKMPPLYLMLRKDMRSIAAREQLATFFREESDRNTVQRLQNPLYQRYFDFLVNLFEHGYGRYLSDRKN